MMNFYDKQKRRILYSHVRIEEEKTPLLDYMTSHFSRFDRNGWLQQIMSGSVTVNDSILPPDAPLKRHDRVSFFPGEQPEPFAEMHYRVVYEDNDLLVIDKPANLCVHPTGPFYRHTLWNLVGQDYGEIRFVSRLDRETSGLVTAVRNAKTAYLWNAMLNAVRKEYLVLVHGSFQGPCRASGVLIPDPDSVIPKKRRFVFNGTHGEFCDTELYTEKTVPPDMTLARAVLHTGRQHQIRATMYSLGFPVVGDKLYGLDETLYQKIHTQNFTPDDMRLLRTDRQCLHAAKLSFPHPVTRRMMCFEAPFSIPPLSF